VLKWLLHSTAGLVAVVTVAFSAATLLIGGAAYEVTHEAIEQQLDHRIEVETAALLTEVARGGVDNVAEAIRRRDAARTTSSLDYLLVSDAGEVLAGMLVTALPDVGYEEFLHYRDTTGTRQGVAQSLTTRLEGATLVVAADRAGLDRIDHTLTILFAASMIAMLAAGVIATLLVGWITRQRLARIDNTAKAIIDGDLTHRIPLDGSDSEFDRLAGTLNNMLRRIEVLMDNLRQVSMDVAHDLRTPLTRLSNRLDRASASSNLADVQSQLTAARSEATNLLELFSALLRIAEIEGMAERLPKERVDLSALVADVADAYLPDMEEEKRELKLHIQQALFVNGDRQLLSQVLANLLDNTLRHTPRGTRVDVRLERSGDTAILTVSDQGPGIAPEDTQRLFQRFERAEKSRSQPGHGLGLSIVGSIVHAHQGTATISAAKPFTLQVTLPLLR
jgi:signal transduction histidine kinase